MIDAISQVQNDTGTNFYEKEIINEEKDRCWRRYHSVFIVFHSPNIGNLIIKNRTSLYKLR